MVPAIMAAQKLIFERLNSMYYAASVSLVLSGSGLRTGGGTVPTPTDGDLEVVDMDAYGAKFASAMMGGLRL